MPKKTPEWLNAEIQAFYPSCQGNIKAIQRAILEKHRVEIAYRTISDRLTQLGLKRSRAKGKAPPTEAPTHTTPEPPALEPTDPVMDEALSAIADMLPAIDGAIDALSPDETETLQYCEHVIEEGVQTFVNVGRALLVIRNQRLYRQSYATFEAYCRERWDLSRTYAYQLIGASEVVDEVAAVSDVVPANEAQVRPLVSLPPEQRVEVWQEAVDTAPPSGITAAHVKRVVTQVKGQPNAPKPRAPEPRRPARQEVQEGLAWCLSEVKDDKAWEVLEWLWDTLNGLAPTYPTLRGVLDRIEPRFPDEHRPLRGLAYEREHADEEPATG
jgi:hypothetical protein